MPLLDALCFQNGQVLKMVYNVKMVFPALALKIVLTTCSPTY